MGPCSKLPFELLSFIFDQLDDSSSLFQCQLTCKGWEEPAKTLIYKKAQIYSIRQLKSFALAMAMSPSHLVETINIQRISEELNHLFHDLTLLEEVYSPIFKYCLNLRYFVTGSLIPSIHYYEKIVDARRQGHCLSLERIPAPSLRVGAFIKSYGDTAWALRDNLTTLLICDKKGQSELTFGKDDDPYCCINQFPRLKSLEFIFEKTSLFRAFSMIRDCDTLQSLTVRQSKQSNYLSRDEPPVDFFDKVYISLMKSCPNLKSLNIANLLSGHEIIRHLAYLFPNLDAINISFAIDKDVLLGSTTASTGTSVRLLLNIYNNLKTYSLDNLLVDNVSEVAYSFLELIHFHGFLVIEYIDSDTNLYKPSICLNNLCGKVQLKVQFYSDKEYGNLPHMNIIEMFGDTLESLTIKLQGLELIENNELHFEHLNGHCLDYIFKKCLKLESLTLKRMMLLHCDPESVISNSIKNLSLEFCQLSANTLPELSQRLPWLAVLKTRACFFRDPRLMLIEMPYTSFTTYEYVDIGIKRHTNFHLKISMQNLSVCYRGDTTELGKCDEDCHSVDIFDEEKLNVHIICRSIKNCIICTKGFKISVSNPGQEHTKFSIIPT